MILLRRYIYTGPIIVNPILTMNDVIHVVLLVQRPKFFGRLKMNRLLRIFAVTLSSVCMHHTVFAICGKYADRVVAERIKPKPGMTLIQTPAQIRSGLERQIQSDASYPDKSFLNKLISDYKELRGIDPSKGLDTAAEMAFLLMRVCAYGGDAEALANGGASQSSTSANTDNNIRNQSVQQQPQPTQQSAQQQSQQAQQTAQQNQARADQQRQGKRKTNDPAAQAHNCIELDKGPGLFGGFKNTCEYKVNYDFCNFRPKKDSWAEFHNCEKPHGIGADAVGAGKPSAAHTKNTEMVYWFACKAPAWPVDSVFVLGKGIEARCHN